MILPLASAENTRFRHSEALVSDKGVIRVFCLEAGLRKVDSVLWEAAIGAMLIRFRSLQECLG